MNITSEFRNETGNTMGRTGFTEYEKLLMILFLICIVVGILFGNGLVIGIFYKYKPLRTVTNYFIVSLAVADVLVGVLSVPLWIAYIHNDLFADAHGMEVYRLWLCIDIMSGVSSVLNLTLISIDRYVRITMGLHYHRLFTSRRVKTMITCIWIYSAALALIKVVFFDWKRPNYEILIFTMGFGVPLLIIGVCHYRIYKVAQLQAKKVRRQSIGQMHEQRHELKSCVVIVVILAFLVLWSPFFLVNLSHGLCSGCKIPGTLITISKWLHYSNSAVNPVIYALMNKEFRSAFHALLLRRRYLLEIGYPVIRV